MNVAENTIRQLIDKYIKVKESGDLKQYDESNTCKDFILPLFEALGWNVYDRREVTAEAPASKGRVDFAFRVDGITKFFLETKALKADIDNPRYAEQVLDYAWHKGVIWAVLSDFEKIKVFNAEWFGKTPQENLFFELTWEDYLSRIDQLTLLSKEAFRDNELDKEATKWGKKKRKIPVDKKLLNDFMYWRKKIANSIRKYPKINNLTEEEMDECIQRILDRLIFIRTCEDRQIEPTTLISNFRESQQRGKRSLQTVLKEIFRDFDKGYNSRIFEPHLSEDLRIDNDVFTEIIEGLYETKDKSIRYDFSAIDADVLGSIYEQYLGHILKKTPKRATLKEKHQHRKEHGIYYTPKYIVDYIVKNTVGAFLKEKSYNDCMNLKILDPACGSGSFLIRVFEEIDNYLTEKRSQKGKLDFDTFRRKEILERNIYGIDLDRQAVEIAQLNLLLKTLATRERLPMLKNIRQGNSLIAGSKEELLKYFGKDWQSKHPFNWQEEFPEVFTKGGFDVVIGNPPYMTFSRVSGSKGMEKDYDNNLKQYLRDKYPDSAEYKLSTYAIFINRAISLLVNKGFFSFIVPDSFLIGRYFSKLRNYILNTCRIVEIILFRRDFWKSGTIGFPVIIVLKKDKNKARRTKNLLKATLADTLEDFVLRRVKSYSYEQGYFEGIKFNRFRLFFDCKDEIIVKRIESNSVGAGELVSLHVGIRPKVGYKKIYTDTKKGIDWKKGIVSGSEVVRYFIKYSGNYIHLNPQLLWGGGFDRNIIEQKKLLMRKTGDRLIVAYDDDKLYHLDILHSIVPRDKNYNMKYIMSILNSKLMNYYYQIITLTSGRVLAQTNIETIEQLPIRKIDFFKPKEKQIHDNLIKLVDKMLELNKKLQKVTPNTDHWRKMKNAIQTTDKKIDNLVFKLYGLTKKDIAIILK